MKVEEIWAELDVKLIAILRGITPEESGAIVLELLAAGIGAIEIPFNSPNAIQSIEIAVATASGCSQNPCLIGAGTVLSVEQVEQVSDVGGNLIVSPNVDEKIIKATKQRDMFSAPGVYTPSECLIAIEAGADCLKVFPASNLGVSGFKAYCAILPNQISLCAVGGVASEDFADYFAAGASAFGLGSSLYAPGMTADEIGARAGAAVAMYKKAAGI